MSNSPKNRCTASARSGNGALILMVLIVMAIGLYLMFGNMGGTSYAQQLKKTRDNGRETAREIRTDQMCLLIAMYRQTNSKLPKTPADLESPGAFNDQWGKEMTFTFEERAGKTVVKLVSAGPDSQPGNADDKTYEATIPY